MSRVVPGLLETFGPGTLVGRIFRDVPSIPRTSWDIWTWDFTLAVMAGRISRDVPNIPRTSWDFWTWDFGSHVW